MATRNLPRLLTALTNKSLVRSGLRSSEYCPTACHSKCPHAGLTWESPQDASEEYGKVANSGVARADGMWQRSMNVTRVANCANSLV